jgi:hypothetical protein
MEEKFIQLVHLEGLLDRLGNMMEVQHVELQPLIYFYFRWKTLCKSHSFNVSIDFFSMGMLVKRPMQAKEHFVLKC